jgi:hypothetical protein
MFHDVLICSIQQCCKYQQYIARIAIYCDYLSLQLLLLEKIAVFQILKISQYFENISIDQQYIRRKWKKSAELRFLDIFGFFCSL